MWVPAPQSALGPLEAGLSPDELRMPEALGGLEVPPVFVAGSARSGTTFTLDVFGQHPEVCTLFETCLFTQVELGYERDRSWWRELLPAAFQSRTVG